MEMSPLQNHEGVNAASALETLAHRLVALHQKKPSDLADGRRVEDVVAISSVREDDIGLDAPMMPAARISFLDRVRHFFSS